MTPRVSQQDRGQGKKKPASCFSMRVVEIGSSGRSTTRIVGQQDQQNNPGQQAQAAQRKQHRGDRQTHDRTGCGSLWLRAQAINRATHGLLRRELNCQSLASGRGHGKETNRSAKDFRPQLGHVPGLPFKPPIQHTVDPKMDFQLTMTCDCSHGLETVNAIF